MGTRREVWLQIALAVARDGLPEPRSLNFNPNIIVCIYADTADEARAWADWIDAESSGQWQAYDDGTRGVHYYGERYGWSWQISAFGLPAETLEQKVTATVTALLTPDAPPDGAA